MLSRQEFLQTADADHTIALEQLRQYSVQVPQFITSNSLTVYVVKHGLYDVFSDIADNPDSPVRSICMALMDRLKGQSEFNLSEQLPLGQANLQMLNTLILALPEHSENISNLRDVLVGISNQIQFPYANATLHDVLIIRNACPTKPVTQSGGWVTITTNADCEAHRPQLHALNRRTGQWQRVNNFGVVSAAGVYDCRVPPEWMGAQLAVDDPYGVI